MTNKKNVTVFKCDFCAKKMFVEKAMIKHEDTCNKNPKNKRACHGCNHLEEIENEYTYMGSDDNIDHKTVKTKAFKCNKFNKIIYPYKVEKLGINKTYPETFEGQEPMPIDCEHFKLF